MVCEGMAAVHALVQHGLHVSRDALYHQLQQCTKKKDLVAGREVHFFLVSKGLDTIAVLVNHLLRFYITCGNLSEAIQVFEISKPNVFSYNAIMAAHAKLGDGNKTLELFDRLQKDRLTPDTCTFLSVLNACSKLGAALEGRLVHNQIIEEGLDVHVSMSNTVIDMYGKCACLNEARRVFDRLSTRDVVSWAAIIGGYTQDGNAAENVLELFGKMKLYDLEPNDVIISCVLKASGKLGLLSVGRFVHEKVIRLGLETLDVIVTALIDMYAKCNNLEDAQKLFEATTSLNVIIWNAIIIGCAQHGKNSVPLTLFQSLLQKGLKPDKVTYLGVLKACANKQDLEQGRALHHCMVHSGLILDLALRNSLMNMYAKCGSIQDVKTIFDSLQNPDILSWGTVIDGYAEHDLGFVALQAFESMQQQGLKPNDVIFVSSLKACIKDGTVEYGRVLHDQVVRGAMESNILIGSSVIDMYAKQGRLEEASNCFDRLQDPDVVAWGAMISGYVQLGFDDLALHMFSEMLLEGLEASEGIFVLILQACVSMDTIVPGSLLHEYMMKHGVQTDGPVGTILVHLYASFGWLEEARLIFSLHSNKDVVTWGAMIAGYVEYGHYVSALELFEKLYTQHVKPNRVIFLCILKACSSIGTIGYGRMLHQEVIEMGLEVDIAVANTIVDMYTKCGSKDDALSVLRNLPKRDVISWSALLGGHVRLGDSKLSLKCFEAMRQDGLQPDNAVFTNILAACSHEGSLEKGLFCFKGMETDYDVMPGFEHYYSVADLLGRAGLFKEAEDLLFSMPNSENIVGWTSLLSGCKTYGNVHASYRCFDAISEMVPNDASSFMLMSSIHSDSVLCK